MLLSEVFITPWKYTLHKNTIEYIEMYSPTETQDLPDTSGDRSSAWQAEGPDLKSC